MKQMLKNLKHRDEGVIYTFKYGVIKQGLLNNVTFK